MATCVVASSLLPATAWPTSCAAARLAKARWFGTLGHKESKKGPKSTLWRWGTFAPSHSAIQSLLPWRAREVSVSSKVPEKVEGLPDSGDITDIAIGPDHGLVIVGGDVYSFGSNRYSQLGRPVEGEGDVDDVPRKVDLPFKAVRVSCGGFHSALVDEEGRLYTWGWGGSGMSGQGGLGHGDRETRDTPTLVQQFIDEKEKVKHIACGNRHSIILTESGRCFSTGLGELGRLGRGNSQSQAAFEEIEFFSLMEPPLDIQTVKCGTHHSAVLSDSGDIWVWGRNDMGQLGIEESIGDVYSHEPYPRVIRTLQLENVKIKQIACGESHMLALCSTGALYFWGARAWLAPKAVTMAPNFANAEIRDPVVKIAGGGSGSQYFNVAVTDSGELYTWGNARSGCLIREGGERNVPIRVNQEAFGDEKVVDIACGRSRVLAVTRPSSSS